MNMLKKLKLVVPLFLMSTLTIFSQEEIKLYPNGPKESNGIRTSEKYRDKEFIVDISEARMFAYPAAKESANGTAVLICPGGGYAGIAYIKEGSELAEWFNDLGVSAFVLYYRMPNGRPLIPGSDAQAALQIIHKRAKEWNIDKKKIGIMGFSAGGHLASTVGTHFKTKAERPAFMILGYPVVTMDKGLTHQGSKDNLLGKQPTEELVQLFSNELRVTKKTPPTFIFHAEDDTVVPIQNSIQLYEALLNKKVVTEFETFAVGGHGFGMRKHGIPADNWPELLKKWLEKTNLIPKN